MKFRKLRPNIGDILQISDQMSLRFEKIAEDLNPIWQPIPKEDASLSPSEGEYLSVNTDLWFVYEQGHWRVMNPAERLEAHRQDYYDTNFL